MATSFQIQSLDYGQFAGYFSMSDEELASLDAVRMIVTDFPGTPCRVSLQDAQVGDEVILVSFTHLEVGSPYHARGPILVRKGVPSATLSPNQVPDMLKSRMLSLRAYNSQRMMLDATVTLGESAESAIQAFFANPETEAIHIHFAKQGCFACSVVRA